MRDIDTQDQLLYRSAIVSSDIAGQRRSLYEHVKKMRSILSSLHVKFPKQVMSHNLLTVKYSCS